MCMHKLDLLSIVASIVASVELNRLSSNVILAISSFYFWNLGVKN
jgi:hypothetical protein